MNEVKYLSEFLGVTKDDLEKKSVFNRVVGYDSFLFIDPRLLGTLSLPEFKEAHDKFYSYFSDILGLLDYYIRTGEKDTDAIVKAQKLLSIKEIKGVGLGYSTKSDNGGGVGPVLASQLAEDGVMLLKYGENDPRIFELLGLFRKNFGPDRLSDMVVSILVDDFITYTQRVMSELKLSPNGEFNINKSKYQLITLPDKSPLIMIPKEVLSKFPISLDFSNISETIIHNEGLREKVNKDLGDKWYEKLKKSKDKRREVFYPDSLAINELIKLTLSRSPQQYDITLDDEGEVNWLEIARQLLKNNPFLDKSIINSKEDLVKFVDLIIDHYKYIIEDGGGTMHLYTASGKIKREKFAQNLFRSIAHLPAKERDIDMSPEVNMGRGPVDFKFSKGFSTKVIIEMKLSKNNIKDKALKQVDQYLKSEEAEYGYLLVIKVQEEDQTKIDELLNLEKEETLNGNKFPRIVIIDGLPKKSASKL